MKNLVFDLDFISMIIELIRFFTNFTPTIFATIDVMTDIIYYVSTPFANNSLKFLFLFFLIFAPFLKFVVFTMSLTHLKYKKGY